MLIVLLAIWRVIFLLIILDFILVWALELVRLKEIVSLFHVGAMIVAYLILAALGGQHLLTHLSLGKHALYHLILALFLAWWLFYALKICILVHIASDDIWRISHNVIAVVFLVSVIDHKLLIVATKGIVISRIICAPDHLASLEALLFELLQDLLLSVLVKWALALGGMDFLRVVLSLEAQLIQSLVKRVRLRNNMA